MKIGRVVIFPCGVQVLTYCPSRPPTLPKLTTLHDPSPIQNLDNFRFPTINSASLAPWVSAGLVFEATPGDDSGIVFQLGWGTKEFNGLLRTLFPALFGYLGTAYPHVLTMEGQPDDVGPKRIHYSWPYVLLKKIRKRYEAVDCTHPTVLVYRDNLSGDKTNSSFRGKALYLGATL